MRGYFGIGVERIHKPFNVGNLFRSAHAFDASFVFTVDAQYERRKLHRVDTSDALGALPYYEFDSADDMMLPRTCRLVGVELTDDAIALPSFRHPIQAAYILGPEAGSLSPGMQERCDFIVKIPSKFCLNVGIAGVLVMYDRLLSRGRFADRPVRPGGPTEDLPEHVHGGPVFRSMDPFRQQPPLAEVEEAATAGAGKPPRRRA
ncbi:putative RNA methyltransferase, TrmH family [Caenispirillum salinarum AK4]|uniref:Putative RNA methyltransferase, TrmH family n=1 Tax=Caenispirillum salinarum AK4 TaxID=1238182 RepID=K9H1W1_9PROT|nr:RNA methyltransferase [Caenispirillum salinarum]EKV32235.1 putative RNA methyltransferase, TrmH family [Caenispirillum salinarum AK4]